MRHARSFEAQIAIGFSACLIGFLFAGAFLIFGPRSYRAAATVEVRPLSTTSVGRESQIILSPEVLSKAVESKRFQWPGAGQEESVERLRKKISVKAVRHTDLIQIEMLDGDPKRAADAANAVAEKYQRHAGGNRVTIWEYAEVPTVPAFPTPIFCILAAVVIALAAWFLFQLMFGR